MLMTRLGMNLSGLVSVLCWCLVNSLGQNEIIKLEEAGLQVKVAAESNTITIYSNGLPKKLLHKRHRGARSVGLEFKVHSYPVKVVDKNGEDTHVCLPPGIIGLAIDGVPIYNPFTKDCCNAGFEERARMDGCWGKLDQQDRYYYDVPPLCAFKNQCNVSTLIGVALDGFPIYGPYDTIGNYVSGLDACNGKDDPFGGYRYHVTEEFPYMIGCFRSHPVALYDCGCTAIKPTCKLSNFDGHVNGTMCCNDLTDCPEFINTHGGLAGRTGTGPGGGSAVSEGSTAALLIGFFVVCLHINAI